MKYTDSIVGVGVDGEADMERGINDRTGNVSVSPNSLVNNVIDKILDQITTIQKSSSDYTNFVIQEDLKEKESSEALDVDSGKDSSNISESKEEDEEDSVNDQSEICDEVVDDVQDVCFMENWKIERQFDKAIEGLKKIKDEPVTLNPKTQLKPPTTLEDCLSDNETFVISPCSENQTYTIKADCESTISPSTVEDNDVVTPIHTDEGIDLQPEVTDNERNLVMKYVTIWRENVEKGKKKLLKARIFHNLNLKVLVLQQWKEFIRKVKVQKEIEAKDRSIEEETIKRYLAVKYRERNIISKVFSAWSLYSKIQNRKRKFEALQEQRETTKRKVDNFLTSLGNISKTNNDWIMQKVKQEKKVAAPSLYSSSRMSRACSGKDNFRILESKEVKEHQFPKIVNNANNKKTLKPVSSRNSESTYSLQKEIINAQRQKMREQWKLINSLKEQKNRLENHRPATNSKVVKRIEKKILIENEINETLGIEEKLDSNINLHRKDWNSGSIKGNIQENNVDENTTNNQEDCEDEARNESNSDCNYSDDFEDCSSETQSSIVPKTPEMLRKVREREERRAARREEIRKFHQERVEVEKERLKALKDKEIQDEIDERKKTREIWKKKRKDEMEKDKKKLSEKERQEKLHEVAREFHRKLTIKQFGLRPWLKLITDLRQKALIANQFYTQNCQR